MTDNYSGVIYIRGKAMMCVQEIWFRQTKNGSWEEVEYNQNTCRWSKVRRGQLLEAA